MRAVIKFLFPAAISLFLVATTLSLLFPTGVRVARNINVPASSRDSVLAAVSDFRDWDQWNSFLRRTPLTNKVWSSPSRGKGAWFTSDQYTIRETASDSEGVALSWSLKGGKQYTGGIGLLSLNADSITIEWWFDLHTQWYPWERLGVFIYDRKLGAAMEESLSGLKQIVEKSR